MTLAQRAVACKGWRWMPGMADLWGGRMREGDGIDRMHALPDLSDAATLGCLLALVREAWGQSAWVQLEDGEWNCFVVDNDQLVYFIGSTEAEALVAALEAAP